MNTHCKKGHEFTSESTYIKSDGKRTCKICKNAADKRWAENNPARCRELHNEAYRRKSEKERPEREARAAERRRLRDERRREREAEKLREAEEKLHRRELKKNSPDFNCSICKRTLPKELRKYERRNRCVECHHKYMSEYRSSQEFKWKERERNRRRLTKGGKTFSSHKGMLGKDNYIKLRKAQQDRCFYCYRKLAEVEEKDVTVDLLVPHSKGGKVTLDNSRLACRSCNSTKGAKALDQALFDGLF